jgi:hypothetical protein
MKWYSGWTRSVFTTDRLCGWKRNRIVGTAMVSVICESNQHPRYARKVMHCPPLQHSRSYPSGAHGDLVAVDNVAASKHEPRCHHVDIMIVVDVLRNSTHTQCSFRSRRGRTPTRDYVLGHRARTTDQLRTACEKSRWESSPGMRTSAAHTSRYAHTQWRGVHTRRGSVCGTYQLFR